MEEILYKAISELQLDKSKWKLTKFGDVAIQQKQSVDRENTELTRYVQGGHMNSEDLHLREWGELKDEYLGPAFIRRFDEGDILYGSRRTYLRKVVIASFSGITSNTTFVAKANEEKIDKRLLPFIMMSEGFTENSIKNSKGSVNPYINWKDIAKYEFLLPPKEQQAKLAKLLWAIDEEIESVIGNINAIDFLKRSTMKELLTKGIGHTKFKKSSLGELPASWEVGTLEDLCEEVFLGLTSKVDYVEEGGYPLVRTKDFSSGSLSFSKVKFISEKQHNKLTKYRKTKKGDILVSKSGSLGTCVIVDTEREFSTYESVITIQPKKEILYNIFLLQILSSFDIQKTMMEKQVGGVVGHLNLLSFRKNIVPVPPLEEQKSIAFKIEKIDHLNAAALAKLSASKGLQKSLINQVF
tara:strand:- start:981 stop:2213 length:1233 start_codon:yes stop_codon:yes gene_type:complete